MTPTQFGQKQAFLAWGGGQVGLHPKGRGIGGELGYTNLLGVLPIPLGGVDIGGPKKGFKAGVTPDANSDFGVSPYLGVRWNHGRRSGLTRNFPRGLPEVIYDKLRGRTREEAYRESYPDTEKPKKPAKEVAEPSKSPDNDTSPKTKSQTKEAAMTPVTFARKMAFAMGAPSAAIVSARPPEPRIPKAPAPPMHPAAKVPQPKKPTIRTPSPTAASAQAASRAMRPATKTAASACTAAGTGESRASYKKAPRYTKSSVGGKKTMPRPYETQTKKAAITALLAVLK